MLLSLLCVVYCVSVVACFVCCSLRANCGVLFVVLFCLMCLLCVVYCVVVVVGCCLLVWSVSVVGCLSVVVACGSWFDCVVRLLGRSLCVVRCLLRLVSVCCLLFVVRCSLRCACRLLRVPW